MLIKDDDQENNNYDDSDADDHVRTMMIDYGR